MNYRKPALIILGCCLINACAHTFNAQVPTSLSQNTATIVVNQSDWATALLGGFVMLPNHDLYIRYVDGKKPGFFDGSRIQVAPGQHRISIDCTLNGRVIGNRTLVINAKPGRTYTIAYPESLKGYNVDFEACQKLNIY